MTNAAAEWFELQRNWWRGTAKIRKELPAFHDDYAMNLLDDWRFQALNETSDLKAMTAAGYDDTGWERRSLGVWGIPDHAEVKHGLLRRNFTVPEKWAGGKISLWVINDNGGTLIDGGRIYLDGKEVETVSSGGPLIQANPDGVLKAGTVHTLAVEARERERWWGRRARRGFLTCRTRSPRWTSRGSGQAPSDYLTYRHYSGAGCVEGRGGTTDDPRGREGGGEECVHRGGRAGGVAGIRVGCNREQHVDWADFELGSVQVGDQHHALDKDWRG